MSTFTNWRSHHQGRNTVADYDQVIVYGDPAEAQRAFPARRGYPNLIVLDPDPLLINYGRYAPMPQVYADLFNLPPGKRSGSSRHSIGSCCSLMSPKQSTEPDPDFVFTVLRQFSTEFPEAILLGGWASYLRAQGGKSHDIDVIVDHATLGMLAAKYRLVPSGHIGGKKYQTELEGVEVDVHPVYQSRLGQRLSIPVEVLANHTEVVEGFKVLSAEAQFVAKMAALLDRPDSLPGDKDRREIWKLANLPDQLDFGKVAEILSGSPHSPREQLGLMEETFRLLEETDTLKKHDLSRLRTLRALALDSVRQVRNRTPLGPDTRLS